MSDKYLQWYQPTYLPVETVCKFYTNPDTSGANRLFTRSLMKIGFIHTEWLDTHPSAVKPEDGEFWRVTVKEEKNVGRKKGCFLLEPIHKIEPSQLARLLPGMYTEVSHNGCLILKPTTIGHNWILPLRHRRAISPREEADAPYAIIVSL